LNRSGQQTKETQQVCKLLHSHIRQKQADVGHPPAILGDWTCGLSLSQVAKGHGISRAMVSKIIRQAKESASHKGDAPTTS